MQLFLQSENLSDENRKMSIVEIPEAVTEKLKNDIDIIPDNNRESKSNGKNELLNDDPAKDDNCVENGDEEKECSNSVSDFNICNGKVNADLDQEMGKLIEDTSEINYSSKDHEKLGNDKDNGDETETVDSSEPTVNNNEITVTKEVKDSNCNSYTSKSSESTSLKTTDNLFNGTEISLSDQALSKKSNEDQGCNELSRDSETIALTQIEERNLNTSLKQIVEKKADSDLTETESDKIESTTHNIDNAGIVEPTRSDVDNSIATESTLTEIKTEDKIQIDEQNVEMPSVENTCNKTIENSVEIKKEAHLLDAEGESNNENSSFGSDFRKSLENPKSIVVSISVKTESEDTEAVSQVGQLQSEKKMSTTEIGTEQCHETNNSTIVSSNISMEPVIDSQPEQETVKIKNEELSNSVKIKSEISNEEKTIASEITKTNESDNMVLFINNDEHNQIVNKNKEHQVTNDVVKNSNESSKVVTYTNNTNLPDVVHEVTERNEEKDLSKEKESTGNSTLAHTLDILSDSDDESHKSNTANTSEKQCINLVDDDDVMLVDDDSTSRDQLVKEVYACNTAPENNAKDVQELDGEELGNDDKIIDDPTDDIMTTTDKLLSPSIQTDDINLEDKSDEIKLLSEPEKPLVPIDFMKYCKPILSEMTRDHLEEFCLQRIVEGIVDRSNFSEVKTKLKVMAQNCEEWRKKAMMLSKQNRDLQIVLKTVQEEQKKKSADMIAPLRITRSVGMQVYMVEPNRNDANATRARRAPPSNRWRGAAPAAGAGASPGAGLGVGRGTSGTGMRGASSPIIPVPRLVPAPTPNTNSPTKTARTPPPIGASAPSPSPQPQLQSAAVSSNTGRAVPTPASPAAGGVTSPAQAQTQTRSGEKRPLNGNGGSQSVTVDLTDDEPPAKQPTRAVGSLRVVPQQQLVAQPRASAPRKVYIPISGTQTQTIRPGQTIMFKNVVPPNQRARNPGGLWMGGSGTGNMVRLAPRTGPRHPAPLPEAPKQAQPPNWKTLPPAPDLKISKVENGIVISWKIDGYQEDTWEEIASYQLYAYQETSTAPSTMLWKKIGDVKALPLPMACTLTQFMAGYKYYFAVRAVDIRSRIGPFSLPGSILLLNK